MTEVRSGVRYGRILLKLSGEALLGERQYGVDPEFCSFIARQLATVHEMGVQVGIVVGGGNIFRGLAAAASGIREFVVGTGGENLNAISTPEANLQSYDTSDFGVLVLDASRRQL